MTLSDVDLDRLIDQQKVLNFCLDQLVAANEAGVKESIKHPYSLIALITIDNIIQLLTLSNEQA